MKSLLEVIAEKGQGYEKEEINVDPGFIAFVDEEPIVVHAVLERTAVVYRLSEFLNRRLVKLGAVMVRPRDIRWRPRNPIIPFSIDNKVYGGPWQKRPRNDTP